LEADSFLNNDLGVPVVEKMEKPGCFSVVYTFNESSTDSQILYSGAINAVEIFKDVFVFKNQSSQLRIACDANKEAKPERIKKFLVNRGEKVSWKKSVEQILKNQRKGSLDPYVYRPSKQINILSPTPPTPEDVNDKDYHPFNKDSEEEEYRFSDEEYNYSDEEDEVDEEEINNTPSREDNFGVLLASIEQVTNLNKQSVEDNFPNSSSIDLNKFEKEVDSSPSVLFSEKSSNSILSLNELTTIPIQDMMSIIKQLPRIGIHLAQDCEPKIGKIPQPNDCAITLFGPSLVVNNATKEVEVILLKNVLNLEHFAKNIQGVSYHKKIALHVSEQDEKALKAMRAGTIQFGYNKRKELNSKSLDHEQEFQKLATVLAPSIDQIYKIACEGDYVNQKKIAESGPRIGSMLFNRAVINRNFPYSCYQKGESFLQGTKIVLAYAGSQANQHTLFISNLNVRLEIQRGDLVILNPNLVRGSMTRLNEPGFFEFQFQTRRFE
jgi:hypothetical protein